MKEGNLENTNRPDDLGTRSDYTPPPMKDHTFSDSRKTTTMSQVLMVVGLILLIIGGVVAAIPMTWRSTQDLADDWEGGDYGYYRTYDEGDMTKVVGEITFETSIDDILVDDVNYNEEDRNYYRALKNRGYNYAYILDDVYDIEIYSKTYLGDFGDEVSLGLTLNFWNLGGTDYWVWVGESKEKENAALYFAIGITIIVLALVVIFSGLKKYLAATRKKRPEMPRIKVEEAPRIVIPLQDPVQPPPPPTEGKTHNIETKNCPHCGIQCLKGYGPCPYCGNEI